MRRVTKTGANQEREEAAENFRTEETITGVEDEGEIRTEERKEICSGATLMATHAYTRNPESPIGKEIDLQQWDTLVFKGEHAENEHWRLVEDSYGRVGYAPAAFLVVILDTIVEEEESDATKKGQENSTEDNQIGGRVGQEGERRKSYSAAVIDGTKINTTIYVGDSIIRKTDSRLNKEEDVVVCLPGARVLDIVLSSQKEFVANVVIQEPLGSSDHNQLHFNINIKSDKTKVKQCRRDFRRGNYEEIRKSLALIDWNDKMNNKTAT